MMGENVLGTLCIQYRDVDTSQYSNHGHQVHGGAYSMSNQERSHGKILQLAWCSAHPVTISLQSDQPKSQEVDVSLDIVSDLLCSVFYGFVPARESEIVTFIPWYTLCSAHTVHFGVAITAVCKDQFHVFCPS